MANIKQNKHINIQNRRASFDYELLTKYVCGIKLYGSEIKSIRNLSVTIKDSYCFIEKNEIFIKNLKIEKFKQAGDNNHEVDRVRKLLLNKKEIIEIENQLINRGITIVCTRLFINERGLAKLEIAVARGKREFDKRNSIKKRDVERELRRTE